MTVPPSQLPTIVTDRYTIERQIGAGGMATVYLARDTKHDREVALKVLRPELGAVLGADRFLSEIKITARLDHPHILTLIDSGAADGLLYYVLPFVRGESLRDLLNRETQLPIDDALSYAKQVGSALDYAHRHGVIHRDIKPENILLQEGEAILTDFGIALAVKEAGGSRLTETGLSLGTPQYMSPEQATGDKTLGPKSDQYSLAAVLYEMLTGEPPIGGANSQSIIAKLLTEEPTHIRTVRKTVPPGIDAAVAKALAKSPADRFGTIGEFLRALDAGKTGATESAAQPVATGNRRTMLIGGVVAAAVIAASAFAFAKMKDGAPKSAPVALRDRTQLTYSGDIIAPAMSQDGKQLAYFTKTCPTEKCTYAVVVQDIGSTEGRKILDGLSAGFSVEMSPDRRNVLLTGTLNGRYGVYLVPVLGGQPRFMGAGGAIFFAGGDSLLLGPSKRLPDSDSTYTVRATSINGDGGETFKVPGGGEGIIAASAIPGTTRFVITVLRNGRGLWQIVDRQGHVTSELYNTCTCGGMAAHDAVWMARAGAAVGEAIVRVAIDPATGKFAAKQDTIYNGRFTGFSVSADGTQFIVDDGTTDFAVAAGSFADFLAGKIGEPVMKSSNNLIGVISPDGHRILKRQTVPDGHGSSTLRLSVIPFGGTAETSLETDGRVVAADWADSVSVWIGSQVSKGMHLTLVDVRNRAYRNDLVIPDSLARSADALPDGWIYVPVKGDRIVVTRDDKQHEIKPLPWFDAVSGVAVSPDASRILYWGFKAPTYDSIGFVVTPIDGSSQTKVFASNAERGSGNWMSDGSIAARVFETPDAMTLTRITLPSGVQRIGTIPHVARQMSLSGDMKRATLTWINSHADAFMYRVVTQ